MFSTPVGNGKHQSNQETTNSLQMITISNNSRRTGTRRVRFAALTERMDFDLVRPSSSCLLTSTTEVVGSRDCHVRQWEYIYTLHQIPRSHDVDRQDRSQRKVVFHNDVERHEFSLADPSATGHCTSTMERLGSRSCHYRRSCIQTLPLWSFTDVEEGLMAMAPPTGIEGKPVQKFLFFILENFVQQIVF